MKKAQEWFDINYPKNKRNEITELNIGIRKLGEELLLQGPLVVEGFRNLQIFNCSYHGWDDKKSGGITNLEIKDCPKLEKINCQYNKITRLYLQSLSNLKELVCNDNNLSNLDLSQNSKLEKINLINNNFQASDLSFLAHLTELKSLELGNWNKNRVENKFYNLFSGSLEHLEKMKNLERLDIGNTDINTGLEKLPDSVKTFSCRKNIREGARVGEIFSALNSPELDGNNIRNFPELLANYKKNKGLGDKKPVGNNEKAELEKKLNEAQNQVAGLKKELSGVKQKLTETENQVDDLNKGQIEVTQNLTKLLDESNKKSEEIKKLKEKLGNNNNQNDQTLQDRIEKLEKELKNNREYIKKLSDESKKKIKGLETEIAELKSQGQQSDNLDEIIKKAKGAKSKTELEESIGLLDSYRNSQPERYEQRKEEIEQLRNLLALKLQLSRYLEKGIEVSDDSKDKQEGIFEERRLARLNLDNFVEQTSPEARQVYQEINKDNEVIACINKLSKKNWNYLLETYEGRADDPSNAKFLNMLNEDKYTKDTWQYKLYWMLQGIAKEYAKSYLANKEMDFYPRADMEGVYGHTNWRDNKGSGFNLHVNFEYRDLTIIFTFIHEIAHDWTMLEELKGLLPQGQVHSLPFWEEHFNSKNSTLIYTMSCFPPEQRERIKDFADPYLFNIENMGDSEMADNHLVYFSDRDSSLKGKQRKKKYLSEKKEELAEEWYSAWRKMLELAEEEVKKVEGWWNNYGSEADKRKVTAQITWSKSKQKRKIYILYDKNTLPSIETEFTKKDGWEEETVVKEKKVARLNSQVCLGMKCGTCESKVHQEAQIEVANSLPFNRKD